MSNTTSSKDDYICSFCGKPQGQVKRLIAGPDQVFICDECVELCDQIITDEKPKETYSPYNPIEKGITPKRIFEQLEDYVVGQTRAKKALSVAVYNHYKRVWANSQNESEVELQKSNILMYGPSGSGKTHLAQTLARILDVPFTIVDATSLTEAGYVGEDVENILLRLIQSADYDIGKAEQGIIYIDEIDKIARKSPNPSITRDVSGEGVQQALLKIIEGCVANVPPQGGRKHPHQEFMQIRTDDILFMLGGAFEGMTDIIDKRINKKYYTMGFNNDVAPNTTALESSTRAQLGAEDLMEYGFIPEFVGRVPVIATLDNLDKLQLIRILTEPKNAFVEQYKALFLMDNVRLDFTDCALAAAAEQALEQQSGARGLKTILESTLTDVMFELPDIENTAQCLIDAENISGNNPVRISIDDGNIVYIRGSVKQTA